MVRDVIDARPLFPVHSSFPVQNECTKLLILFAHLPLYCRPSTAYRYKPTNADLFALFHCLMRPNLPFTVKRSLFTCAETIQTVFESDLNISIMMQTLPLPHGFGCAPKRAIQLQKFEGAKRVRFEAFLLEIRSQSPSNQFD
jgi:hypothetical protein